MKPCNLQGYQLMHEGIQVFAEMERTGINIDMDYCIGTKRRLETRIKILTDSLHKDRHVKLWKGIEGDGFNLNSTKQLGNLLYKVLKRKPYAYTAGSKDKADGEKTGKVDEESLLKHSDLAFIEKFIQIKKYTNILNTHLIPLIEEIGDDGLLHCFSDLHIPRTYRSSCSKINFQNIPKHNPMLRDIIWKAIIPRKDHMLLFIDFSGVEVRGGCCYHKDKQMIEDVLNPMNDMHRDALCKILKVSPQDSNKVLRFLAKNNFVFAEFYGDYYVNCARNFWNGIDENQATMNDGTPVKEYLKSIGMPDLKSFTDHMKTVEDWLWKEKYPGYARWKNDIWKQYQRNKFYDTYTGFRLQGVMAKNDISNYPIQGSSFHILLWSCIFVHRMLKKLKYRSKVIGQIHDCLVLDIHPDEYNNVISICFQYMTEEVRKHWDWITLPLEVEAELTRMNEDATTLQEIHKHDCPVCSAKYMFKEKKDEKMIWVCPLCDNEEDVTIQ